jgi:protein-L-isoaspartate(D-aspartate) O-methyltransferase
MTTAATFETARRNMVEYQIRCCKVLDPNLLDMLETMPREEFLPEHVRSLAYMEGHVPLPAGQEMLSPLQEAAILQHLQLNGSERVLEIGSGTGYLTTLLAMRAGEVDSCEIHQELAGMASSNLDNHGIRNAKVMHLNAMDAEAMEQHPEIRDSYDVIVIGAALKEIPAHLKALLSQSGQLIAFVGQNPVVSLVHEQHHNSSCIRTGIFETLLQDIEGVPERREFVF